jgi:hypothetical protein
LYSCSKGARRTTPSASISGLLMNPALAALSINSGKLEL